MPKRINLEVGKFVFTETSPYEAIKHIVEEYLNPHKLHPEYEKMKQDITDRLIKEYGIPADFLS